MYKKDENCTKSTFSITIKIKGGVHMGRPKGGTNRRYTIEEKEKIVKRYLNNGESYPTLEKETGIPHRNIERWVKKYLNNGKEGLVNQKKTGNRYSALHTSKNISEVERLKLELMKKEIEIERLKKGYYVKGDGSNKEYITTSKKNLK